MINIKTVKGFPDYTVDTNGTVINIKTNLVLKQSITPKGYFTVELHNKETKKHWKARVHRLVLMTFNPVENMENLQVNHKDTDKSNNHLDNLEWNDVHQNIQHAFDHGLRPQDFRNTKTNINCKINLKTARNIRKLKADGMSVNQICEKYNAITKSMIYKILQNKYWKK